ncbi:hypothetical protein [Mycolicibacterium goodii]|uniref:hypothetical protein n=1 Tax=Mycolicibacterium goodii TaxID=134601 RepID=UPI000A90CC73
MKSDFIGSPGVRRFRDLPTAGPEDAVVCVAGAFDPITADLSDFHRCSRSILSLLGS